MSNMVKQYGGLILFYGILIFSFFLLSMRYQYLNNMEKVEENSKKIALQN